MSSFVLEAMARGTPVTGSDTGGIREMVRPGAYRRSGPDRPRGRPAAVLLDRVREKDRRAELGRNCRRIAVEERSLEVQAPRYAARYESVLGASQGRDGRSVSKRKQDCI
jgi:glycosyltransferase involved in cell wall biosynthesis